jgi:predicted enzyme related to lactoylglutathione lyase
MLGHLTHVTVYVNDQDQARDFYRDVLGFTVTDDAEFGPGMRWLTVLPPGGQTNLVLFKAGPGPMGDKHAGGYSGMVLHTDSVDQLYADLSAKGVKFTQAPRDLPWGRDVTFEDPDGNAFNVVQPKG